MALRGCTSTSLQTGGEQGRLVCHEGTFDPLHHDHAVVRHRDGGYWERRDPNKLAEAVQAWNGVDLTFPEGE
jgi:hypothetical protein